MRPQERGEDEQPERQAPTAPQRDEEQRDDQEVRRRERAEERRGEATEDDAVPGVVDEVLRQARQSVVRQPELVVEPAGCGPPERERDRIDIDQSERRDEGGGREHGVAEAGALAVGQREPAAQEVRGDGKQVVAGGVQDPLVRRAAAEPRLRQQPVQDDERAEREREPIREAAVEGQPAALSHDEHEGNEQQHVLPRRHHRERCTADPGTPEQRHDDVVQRKPDDQDLQCDDGAFHAEPTAMSVMPVLITRTL